jgi:hypothetical protein
MKSQLRYLLPLLAVAAGPLVGAEVKALRVLAQAGPATADKVERRVTIRHAGAPAEMEKVAFLGVSTGPVSPTLAAQLGLTPGAGLVVNQIVPASPAAGVLQVHDVLVKLDDQLLIEMNQLAVLVRSHKEGDEVTVTYLRGGKQATAKVKLAVHDAPKLSLGGGSWPTNGTINIFGSDGAPGSFGRQEVDRVLSMIDAQRVPPAAAAGPNVRVMKMNTENSTMVLSDEEGSIEITTKEGQKHLVAKDAKGNPICEGPITTLREQAAIPAGVLERLKKLEGLQDFQFKTGEEFKGGEVKVLTPPARKVSLPRAAAPVRPAETF